VQRIADYSVAAIGDLKGLENWKIFAKNETDSGGTRDQVVQCGTLFAFAGLRGVSM